MCPSLGKCGTVGFSRVCGMSQTPSFHASPGTLLPPELQQAAQETLAAVANPAKPQPLSPGTSGSTSSADAAGMDAAWTRLSDGLTSSDAAETAAAQAWLLQLLVAAAQRQQQEASGVKIVYALEEPRRKSRRKPDLGMDATWVERTV